MWRTAIVSLMSMFRSAKAFFWVRSQRIGAPTDRISIGKPLDDMEIEKSNIFQL
jgi:hypothetical protein